MNNQNVNGQPEQVQAQVTEQPVDNRTVTAIEIGTLRNDKIGKPTLVIWIFILFAVVFVSLPVIRSQMNNPNSFLYKMIYKESNDPVTPVIPTDPDVEEFVDAKELQPLTESTKMKYENIVLKGFKKDEKVLTATIYSANGVEDLDSRELYLEIYSNSKNLIGYIKLTGTFDYQEKEVELIGSRINYNQGANYYALVKEMNEVDYPEVEYTTTVNAEGITEGSIVCQKDNSKITYTFKNNSISSILDEETVLKEDDSTYTYLLSEYQKKVEAFGTLYASLVEGANDIQGFVVNVNIKYDDPEFKMPSVIKDYNYFDGEANVKKIHYNMTGKGFECK